MNTLIAIHPYKSKGMWFRRSRRQEPFVSGADAIIDRLAQEIPNATWGSTLVFSAQPFQGFKLSLNGGGKSSAGTGTTALSRLEGWLCPALLKYFDSAQR